MHVNVTEYSLEPCGLGLEAQWSCVFTAPPKRQEGRRHLQTVALHRLCCLWKVFIFPWISYSLLLKVTAVCNLWQKASSFFGCGSLAFFFFFSLLEVFSSQTAIISETCFMLSLSDASSLSFLEQNVMRYIYIYIYIWNFLKHRIESHMVMIWACQAWFFFQSVRGKKKKTSYLFLWAVNSQ